MAQSACQKVQTLMLATQMIMLLFDTNRFNLNLHNINNVADSLIENDFSNLTMIEQYIETALLIRCHCIKEIKSYFEATKSQQTPAQQVETNNNNNNAPVTNQLFHCGVFILVTCCDVINWLVSNCQCGDFDYKKMYFDLLKHIIDFMKMVTFDHCKNEKSMFYNDEKFLEIPGKLLSSIHVCERIEDKIFEFEFEKHDLKQKLSFKSIITSQYFKDMINICFKQGGREYEIEDIHVELKRGLCLVLERVVHSKRLHSMKRDEFLINTANGALLKFLVQRASMIHGNDTGKNALDAMKCIHYLFDEPTRVLDPECVQLYAVGSDYNCYCNDGIEKYISDYIQTKNDLAIYRLQRAFNAHDHMRKLLHEFGCLKPITKWVNSINIDDYKLNQAHDHDVKYRHSKITHDRVFVYVNKDYSRSDPNLFNRKIFMSLLFGLQYLAILCIKYIVDIEIELILNYYCVILNIGDINRMDEYNQDNHQLQQHQQQQPDELTSTLKQLINYPLIDQSFQTWIPARVSKLSNSSHLSDLSDILFDRFESVIASLYLLHLVEMNLANPPFICALRLVRDYNQGYSCAIYPTKHDALSILLCEFFVPNVLHPTHCPMIYFVTVTSMIENTLLQDEDFGFLMQLTTCIDLVSNYICQIINTNSAQHWCDWNNITTTTLSWEIIARVWFHSRGPLAFIAAQYDTLLTNIKRLMIENETRQCTKYAYQQFYRRAFLWLPTLMKVSSQLRIIQWYRAPIHNTPYQFVIFLAIEQILVHDISVSMKIVEKMMKKICYSALIVASYSSNISCDFWRIAGIYYLYYENDVKRSVYCFTKALKSGHCNKMQSLKHLAVIFTLIDDRKRASKYIDQLIDEFEVTYTSINGEQENVHMFSQSLENAATQWNSADDGTLDIEKARCFSKRYIFDANDGPDEEIATQIKSIFEIEENINIMYNFIMNKECHWEKCKKKTKKLFRCKRCKAVFYCSKLCQKKDWKMSVHGSTPHRQRCVKKVSNSVSND